MKTTREPQYKRNAKGKPQSQPFPIVIENITGLRATHDIWPSFRGVFTGCSVLVSHHEDAQALHTMGCFGQATTPHFQSPGPKILRRRQFKTRRDWALLTAEQKLAQKGDDSDSSDSSEEAIPLIIPPKKREIYLREERSDRTSSSRMKNNHQAVGRQWFRANWDECSGERDVEMSCSEEEEQSHKKRKSISDDEVVILSDNEEPAEKENSDPNQPRSNGRLAQDDIELVSIIEDEIIELPQKSTPSSGIESMSPPNSPTPKKNPESITIEDVSVIEQFLSSKSTVDPDSSNSESVSPPNSPGDTPKKNSESSKSITTEDVSVIEQFLSSKGTANPDSSKSTEKVTIEDVNVIEQFLSGKSKVDLDSSSAGSSNQKLTENQEMQDSDDDDFHLEVSDDESQNSADKPQQGKDKNFEHSQDMFGSSEEESPQVESQDFKLQVSSDDSHPTVDDGSQDFHLRVSSDDTLLDGPEIIELDGPARSKLAVLGESDEEVVELEEEANSVQLEEDEEANSVQLEEDEANSVQDQSSDDMEQVDVPVKVPRKRKRTPDEEVIVIADSDCEGDKSALMAKWYPELVSAKDLQQNCDESLVLSLEEAFFLMKALGCLTIAAPASHLHRLLPPQPAPDPSRSPQPGPSGLQNFPNVAAVFGLHQLKDEKVLLTPEIAWQLFSVTQESFASRYVIYHYFRAHNFVVRSGLKFGGDFLLYREGPSRTHASYVVLVMRQGSNSWQHIMTANRIAETTRKEVLLSWVQWPESGASLLNLQNVMVWEQLVSRIRPNRQLVELSSSEQDTDLDSE